MRITGKVLLLHQHVHVRTPRGIGAHELAVKALRMITDELAHVVNLTPVRQAEQGESERIHVYPDNVECKALYEWRAGQSRVRAALLQVRAVPAIAREVARADVVYARLPTYPGFTAGLVAVLARKPLMISIHGNFGEVLLARRGRALPWRALAGAVDAYQRMLARRSRVVMITGEHTRALGGERAELISQHQFEAGDVHERRDTCQARPVRLLYVGLLSTSKGMEHLLDAMVELGAAGAPCTLTLAGAASGYDVHAAIARRGLGGVVTVKGQVSWGAELFALHRASDIFVFPSLSEGVPKAPMEALSQGLPVVATPPGTSTYVEHERSGLLVPVADARALAAAIRRMIDDGELRRRCIAGGLEVARAHTRERMQERIRAILARAFAPEGPDHDEAVAHVARAGEARA